MKNKIISDIKSDINPKTWLSKYRRTSVGYLMAMFLFYIGVGLVLGNGIGTPIIKNLIPHYQKPSDFLTSLDVALAAGPVEDTLFFGIPFYLSFGNHFLVLAGGIVWTILHLGLGMVSVNQIPYANWLSVIPLMFFFLRTWVSGKGWFGIVIHSAYDGITFTIHCISGIIPCTIFPYQGNLYGIVLITMSAALSSLIYIIYKKTTRYIKEYYDINYNNKQIQFQQLKWTAIFLAIIITASLFTVYYYNSFLVIALELIFLLSFIRNDDTNYNNKKFQFQQLKWLAIFITANLVISLLVPQPFVMIFIAAYFMLATFIRKRRLPSMGLSNLLMFGSKREQLMWIAISVTIMVSFSFKVPFPFSFIAIYGVLLLMCRYIMVISQLKSSITIN